MLKDLTSTSNESEVFFGVLPATRTVQSSFTTGLGALDVFASPHCYDIITSLLCQGFLQSFPAAKQGIRRVARPPAGERERGETRPQAKNPPAGAEPALPGRACRPMCISACRASGGRVGQRPRVLARAAAPRGQRRRDERALCGRCPAPAEAVAARNEAAPGWACYLCGDALSYYLIDSYIIPSRVPKKLV